MDDDTKKTIIRAGRQLGFTYSHTAIMNGNPICECGKMNEWVKIPNMDASFWGCKRCYHNEMRKSIRLVKG